MKKIVLFSVLFGLFTSSAFATYYQTTTSNCSDAAMMARLDSATAEHRAVITDVTCEYSVPVVKPAPVVMPKPKHYTMQKRFVNREVRPVRPIQVVQPVQIVQPVIVHEPSFVVVSVVKEESCACFDDCDC